MRCIVALALLALAACGADAPPQPPAPEAQPGISLSGEVQMGVIVNPRYVEQ